ncbi:hypothetical protein K4K49_012986 [Colletotrichum sp. SAR 10_70]|nr:hypothetical protein K4K50_012736 [Colletotrichum sp. SAR 10_71]KAI8187696.1 hypothetical protein K4K49_012986 [Colletotrichum sp. SAR 10_70]
MFSKLGPEDLEWVEIVPPSFDGTQIPMPLNQGRRALRSQKTTASLLLPDVYTLGLPDYQNETRKDCGLVMRKVIVHKSWATPAMLSEPSVKKYSGPMRLAEKKLQRYKTKGGLQLWTTPKKIVRAPWRGVNVPFINNVADEANRRPTTAPERGIDQRQTGRLESSAVSREAVIEFSQKLVMQFRKARENGLIAPSVRFGDNGLTWDGMQESDKFTKRLPSGISIDDMVSVDAALQADLLSKEDRSLLQKLLTNLDHAHGVPRRVKLFASTLDQSDPGLTKTKTAALMEEMGGQISSAMSCLAENGDGQQRGMDTLTEHIIKPCCVLLDLEYPGSHSEGHRAIVQADFEVGMAISDIMYQAMLPGPGGLREAIQKLKRSKKLMPIWSFLLLKDNFKGIVFDEEHRALWALVFGEPYGVGTQTE